MTADSTGISFSPAGYRRLLSEFSAAGYKFSRFEELLPAFPKISLRHDVDYSVEYALEIARWDAEMGISSDFYFLVDTGFYNVAESRTRLQLNEIRSLGHRIGLHFDERAQSAPGEHLVERLQGDAAALSFFCGDPVTIVSFHRPSAAAHNGEIATGTLRNPRDTSTLRGLSYFSESRGSFRFGSPLQSDAFTNRLAFQLLLHPVWWVEGPPGPEDRLASVLADKASLHHAAMIANSAPFAERFDSGQSR